MVVSSFWSKDGLVRHLMLSYSQQLGLGVGHHPSRNHQN